MNLPDVEKVGDKTRQGFKWSFSLQFVQKAFFFIGSIILARILTPTDFGLATMALTFDTITWLVLSLGVNSAVMYFQDNVEERFNAAFWLYLVSSTVFVIIQISLAPIVAHFYKEPLLIPIIRYSAIGLFIMSFGAIQKTILSKSIDFKKISIIDTAMNLLRNIFYVGFAIAGFGVWSFIYPKVIVALIQVSCLWNITKWRPKFKFYFKYWGEMLSYGKNVLLSNIIDYTLNNSTYILIGSMVGSASLGIYSFAYDKSMMIVNNIAYPFTAISFPAFSRLQDHKDKLKNAFFKTMKMVSLMAFPYAFAQIVIGPEFINVVFGHKWQASIVLFQMILVYSMLRSIVQSGNPILQATGNPNIALRWNLVFAPIYIGSIYLGYRLDGIFGIAAATAITGAIGSLTYLSIIIRVLKWNFDDVFSTLKPALFSSILMASILFIIRIILKFLGASNIFILATLVPLGMAIYILEIRHLFPETNDFILENLSKFIGTKKGLINVFSRQSA